MEKENERLFREIQERNRLFRSHNKKREDAAVII